MLEEVVGLAKRLTAVAVVSKAAAGQEEGEAKAPGVLRYSRA